MPIYSVIRKADSKEVTRYAAAVLHFLDEYPLADFNHVEYVENAAPTTVYGGRRVLSRLEFMRLFTQAERVAIKDFALGTTAQAKAVRDFMYMMELAGEISLDDADTVQGCNFLENRSLIAAGRAAEILNG